MSPQKPTLAEKLSHTPLSLASKLGSICVHAEEMMSPIGHAFDVEVLRVLLKDAEVVEFLNALRSFSLLPVKR